MWTGRDDVCVLYWLSDPTTERSIIDDVTLTLFSTILQSL